MQVFKITHSLVLVFVYNFEFTNNNKIIFNFKIFDLNLEKVVLLLLLNMVKYYAIWGNKEQTFVIYLYYLDFRKKIY